MPASCNNSLALRSASLLGFYTHPSILIHSFAFLCHIVADSLHYDLTGIQELT